MQKVDKKFRKENNISDDYCGKFQSLYYEDKGSYYLIEHRWNILSKILAIVGLPVVIIIFAIGGAFYGAFKGFKEITSPFRKDTQLGNVTISKIKNGGNDEI